MSEADRDLVPNQFPALNKQFYERCPADYFGHRLRLLLTFWGRPDDVLDLFDEGVTVGELSAGGHVDLKEDSVERFVTADLEVLWHHTAESMMRAYGSVVTRTSAPATLSRYMAASSVAPMSVTRRQTQHP